MLRSMLIGAVAGMRSMTPLAAVAEAGRHGWLARGNGAPGFLTHPLVAAGATVLAVGELFGDKMRSAPDRIVAPGIAARLLTGALAGAAVAPRDRRATAMVVGAATAVAASYVTFALRMKALRRYGQTKSGLVEDAITLGSTALLIGGLGRSKAPAAQAAPNPAPTAAPASPPRPQRRLGFRPRSAAPASASASASPPQPAQAASGRGPGRLRRAARPAGKAW
jgi:uncharacterized membrane protein